MFAPEEETPNEQVARVAFESLGLSVRRPKYNPSPSDLRHWARLSFGWSNRTFKRVSLAQIRKMWHETYRRLYMPIRSVVESNALDTNSMRVVFNCTWGSDFIVQASVAQR